jgi:DNA-binding NarL/FixJ family response regulator
MSAVRVVLVDDHRLVRSGVRAELGPEVDVVGEAADVDEAVRVITDTRPDVVLLDVHLPGGGGAEVIRGVHGQLPAIRFLALSVSDAGRVRRRGVRPTAGRLRARCLLRRRGRSAG